MGRTNPTLASLVDAELTRQATSAIKPPALSTVATGDSSNVIIDLRGPIALRIEALERGSEGSTYRHLARSYDNATSVFNAFRARAVDRLELTAGQVVLDVGCGTGLCFSMVQERIGPTGWVIGIDRSAEMLELAGVRCVRQGWRNVTLIESDAASADIRRMADAALFCAAHDILQSSGAIRNVLRHVRPGGRCVAVGAKWAPPWLFGLNVVTALAHRPYVGSFVGFDEPWKVLMQFVPQLQVTEMAFGAGYAAVGRL